MAEWSAASTAESKVVTKAESSAEMRGVAQVDWLDAKMAESRVEK
jgi:hypothetical protein